MRSTPFQPGIYYYEYTEGLHANINEVITTEHEGYTYLLIKIKQPSIFRLLDHKPL